MDQNKFASPGYSKQIAGVKILYDWDVSNLVTHREKLQQVWLQQMLVFGPRYGNKETQFIPEGWKFGAS